MDATRTTPLEVHWANLGSISLGERNDTITARLLPVEALLECCAIPHNGPASIMRHLWSKFMLNTGVNQVCGRGLGSRGGAAAVRPASATGCQEALGRR